MQIQLKQAEIVAALKEYIARKGIQLDGKEVQITFTAGRKNSGLSADLSIEETSFDIPGYSDDADETKSAEVKAIALTVVPPAPKAEDDKPQVQEPESEKAPPPPEAAPAISSAKSLFAN